MNQRAQELHLGLDAADAFRVLAREDLVHVDATGRPVVAYPFSAEPRGHRVLIHGERWVEAMCAIDALGIAPMLGLPIEIYSRDPVSGREIWVRLDPGEGAWWEPQKAVVVSGSAGGESPSFRGCCDVLNLFERRENAERYLAENPSVSGSPISLPEAIEAGRIVFGDVLREED
jgi:Alkylmercury lyase